MPPTTRGAASKKPASPPPKTTEPPKRPLKRSASLASLPTPPRTRRNPGSARSQSRGSVESDTDSDSDHESTTSQKSDKRRRVSEEVDGADEEAFWLDKKDKGKEPVRTRTRSPSPDDDEPVEYVVSSRVTRQKSAAIASTSLASPPPSRRHLPAPTKPVAALPVTPNRPTTRSQTKKTWTLLKDTPDNPFVDTPGKGTEEDEDELPVFKPRDVTPSPAEKPTVTYVFRGKRAQFANPYYVSPSETAELKAKREHKYHLPLDHPDYSPDPCCPPKRLFFSKTSKTVAKKETTSKATVKTMLLSQFDSDDEEEEDLFAGDVKGVAKRLFVEGAGKGSVDAGMAKVTVVLKPDGAEDD